MRKLALAAVAALSLTGCASFKMGAVCYLPAGHAGICQVQPPVQLMLQPAAPGA
jgi:hypothetical protein